MRKAAKKSLSPPRFRTAASSCDAVTGLCGNRATSPRFASTMVSRMLMICCHAPTAPAPRCHAKTRRRKEKHIIRNVPAHCGLGVNSFRDLCGLCGLA